MHPGKDDAVKVGTAARMLAGLILAGVLFSACVSAKKPEPKMTSAEPNRLIRAGDFEKAIDPFKEARRRNPGDRALAAKYLGTVENIKLAADRAAVNKNYGLAQAGYQVLRANYGDFTGFASKLSFTKKDVEAGIRSCRMNLTEAEFRRTIAIADYPRALKAYRTIYADYPGDAKIVGRFAEAAGEIRAAGARALDARDYALAGRIHALLVRNYASFEKLEPGVGFSRGDLTKAIGVCRVNLTNSGLTEYRKGNLAEAITVWESLLAFDPENTEVKKAVDTAKVQLREIKKKD